MNIDNMILCKLRIKKRRINPLSCPLSRRKRPPCQRRTPAISVDVYYRNGCSESATELCSEYVTAIIRTKSFPYDCKSR